MCLFPKFILQEAFHLRGRGSLETLAQPKLLVCTRLEGAELFLQTTPFLPESPLILGLHWELARLRKGV